MVARFAVHMHTSAGALALTGVHVEEPNTISSGPQTRETELYGEPANGGSRKIRVLSRGRGGGVERGSYRSSHRLYPVDLAIAE